MKAWIYLIIAILLLSLSIYLLGPDIWKFLTSWIPKNPLLPAQPKKIGGYDLECDGGRFSVDAKAKTIIDINAGGSSTDITIPYIWENKCDRFDLNIKDGSETNLDIVLWCGDKPIWNYQNSTLSGYSISYTCQDRIKVMLQTFK